MTRSNTAALNGAKMRRPPLPPSGGVILALVAYLAMQAKRRKRPHAVRPRGSRSPFKEKEIAELSALEADIRAGRITEADGTSLENGWPGARSQGDTLDELRKNLEEVITMLLEDGEPKLDAEFVGTQTLKVA